MTALALAAFGCTVAVCVTYLRAQRQRMEHAPLADLQKRLEVLEARQKAADLSALSHMRR